MWQMEQMYKHSVCGTFDWEWEENPQAWHADIYLCLACRSIELKSQTIKDAVHPEGYQIRLYRGEEPDGDDI